MKKAMRKKKKMKKKNIKNQFQGKKLKKTLKMI